MQLGILLVWKSGDYRFSSEIRELINCGLLVEILVQGMDSLLN